MAVYYKFKSAKEFDTVAIDGHYISVGTLKEKIFELKHLGRGTDFDIVVSNAQTDEEYLDEGMLVPKNTSVIIRRIPGKPRKPIVTAPVTEIAESMVDNNSGDVQALNGSFAGVEPSSMQYGDDADWDGFGNDLYAIPETMPVRSSIPVQDAAPAIKENEDEDSMIRALVETPALDWQRQPESFGSGRGFQRGGGRMMGGRGFGGGRGGPYESKTPPPGYVCHRCKVAGHFIQHCPTNGDPNYDIRRVKPPTGIPKSMLFATPDGPYALPSGAVAVLKPNEAAFEKEIEGMPSTRSVGDLPPELHCPLCKGVIKDAVLTSKCCFTSYCDKCIRDHIISKSMCVCGATNVLADDLLPNKTLRDTINRILESNDSSAEKGGSAFQVQDMESRIPQVKAQSPAQSAASKGQGSAQPLQKEETSEIAEGVEENKVTVSEALGKQENMRTPQVPDVLEGTNDLKNFKEAHSQGSAQLADEEVHQKPPSGEEGKKKKKKKIRVLPNAADMQWRGGEEPGPGPGGYMMPPGPMGPAGFDPFWNGGMGPGPMDCFPYPPGPMPYMNMNGYVPGPMDMPFPGIMPHDPFMGNMFPYGPPPPHRDLSELSMGFNPRPPMSREEFEAHKADVKRRREMERRGDRDMPRDQDYGRDPNSRREVSKDRNYGRDSKDSRDYGREESSRVDNGSLKSKSKSTSHHQSGSHRSSSRASPEGRPRDSSKRDLRHHDDRHRTARDRSESPTDKKLKGSVFSRISFGPGGKEAAPKKRKSSENVSDSRPASNGYHEEQRSKKSSAVSVEQDSSDDERHFKRRRPSKYSSPPADVAEEDSHHSRGRDYGRKRR